MNLPGLVVILPLLIFGCARDNYYGDSMGWYGENGSMRSGYPSGYYDGPRGLYGPYSPYGPYGSYSPYGGYLSAPGYYRERDGRGHDNRDHDKDGQNRHHHGDRDRPGAEHPRHDREKALERRREHNPPERAHRDRAERKASDSDRGTRSGRSGR